MASFMYYERKLSNNNNSMAHALRFELLKEFICDETMRLSCVRCPLSLLLRSNVTVEAHFEERLR